MVWYPWMEDYRPRRNEERPALHIPAPEPSTTAPRPATEADNVPRVITIQVWDKDA